MQIKFAEQGWQDYLYWQQNDKALLKRINTLIHEISRAPFDGIGKPEALRHNLAGFWSRRINEEHRLVCAIENGCLLIAQCRYHY